MGQAWMQHITSVHIHCLDPSPWPCLPAGQAEKYDLAVCPGGKQAFG